MKELILLGGGSKLYQPDALGSFAGSAEDSVRFRILMKPYVPPDPRTGAPASESHFRRVFMTVVHTNGFAFWATPLVDGILYPKWRRYYSRPAPETPEERRSVLIALSKRGTSTSMLIEAEDPPDTWHFETAVFAFEPLSALRARTVSE